MLGKLNNLEKAINSYELAVAVREKFASAWFNMGNANADLGRLKKSLECFTKAKEIDPEDEAVLYNLGNIYEELGELNRAIQFYSMAIKINDEYYEAYDPLFHLLVNGIH